MNYYCLFSFIFKLSYSFVNNYVNRKLKAKEYAFRLTFTQKNNHPRLSTKMLFFKLRIAFHASV